jgi:excinuclease ABC subunit C
VIDGGAGQLAAARAALDRTATRAAPLVALAKREETVVREHAAPLTLPRRSPSLRALQRIRDEAHRFGLAYHRRLRTRAQVTSALDHVSGIGPARRAALLKSFGSIAALKEASEEEIAREGHIAPALAHRVLEALRAVTDGTTGRRAS